MLSFHPEDRPTIEQILNHPWFKASSSSSSSHHKPRQSSSSGTTSSFRTSYVPSPASSSHYTTPNYLRPSRHRAPPPSSPSPSSQQFSKKDSSSRPDPPSSTHTTPMQTRSQTRLNRSCQGDPPKGGGVTGHRNEGYSYGGCGYGQSACTSTWINNSPRIPQQVRKGQSAQVPRK